MQKEKKLYAVYLGGKAPRSNIELHDVVFVVGDSLEETYPKLKAKWFAYPEKTPHIDSYMELTHVDGFQIKLVQGKRNNGSHKLYFINFGGYLENLFGEVHQSAFYVAKDPAEATQKARKELCLGLEQTHLDDRLDVENLVAFDVDDILEMTHVDGYHFEFLPTEVKTKPIPISGNIRL